MFAPLIKPARLQAGDRVAAVSLSWGGPGEVPHRFDAGKQQLEAALGVTVVESAHCRKPADWLARNPQARAEDLLQAFADPGIKAIITSIGGDDSIRMLRHMDLDLIRANPKIFLGYSDSTITHLTCLRAGLVSFYGPSIMSGFGESGGLHPYLLRAVRQVLMTPGPAGEITPNTDGWVVEQRPWSDPANQALPRPLLPALPWRFVRGQGRVQGHLLGGCLEGLDFVRGTRWWPTPAQWDGAILFLETSEDGLPPHALRYFLRALAEQGTLQRLNGILFGRPGGPIDPTRFADYDAEILRVLDEEGLADTAVVTHMDFGHTDPMGVLPYGVLAEIDCDTRRVSLIEEATRE